MFALTSRHAPVELRQLRPRGQRQSWLKMRRVRRYTRANTNTGGQLDKVRSATHSRSSPTIQHADTNQLERTIGHSNVLKPMCASILRHASVNRKVQTTICDWANANARDLALKVVGNAMEPWRNDLYAYMQVASASAEAAIDVTRGLRGCASIRVTVPRLPYVVALTCGTCSGMCLHPESPQNGLSTQMGRGSRRVARLCPAFHLTLLLTAC